MLYLVKGPNGKIREVPMELHDAVVDDTIVPETLRVTRYEACVLATLLHFGDLDVSYTLLDRFMLIWWNHNYRALKQGWREQARVSWGFWFLYWFGFTPTPQAQIRIAVTQLVEAGLVDYYDLSRNEEPMIGMYQLSKRARRLLA